MILTIIIQNTVWIMKLIKMFKGQLKATIFFYYSAAFWSNI